MKKITFFALFSVFYLFSNSKEVNRSLYTAATRVSTALADANASDEGSSLTKRGVNIRTLINSDRPDQDEQRPFVTTWKTDNDGESADDQITIPTFPGETYDYTVDWGDGITDTGLTGDITHTYPTSGTYTVRISGIFPRIFFETAGDKDKLLSIDQWGDNTWTSMRGAFSGCSNVMRGFSDIPDLTNVTDMQQMFLGARSFGARRLNSNIGDWDVSNVTNMRGLFQNAGSFNSDIGDWDVSNVTNMSSMFFNARVFNQQIGNWDVSSVTNMSSMFRGTATFNQNIRDWDVGNVLSMPNMFNGALEFDQNIGGWNVSNVNNMSSMFLNAFTFNGDFRNYDALLTGWSRLPNLKRGVDFGVGNSQYCLGEAPRQRLIEDYGWVITDRGRSEDCGTEGDDRPFITTWTTDNDGESADDQITIPTFPGETYDYTVDWGDGSTDTGVFGDITHTYDSIGTYTVSISGTFPRIYFNEALNPFDASFGDSRKIITIEQWGDISWTSMKAAFSGCRMLQGNFTDAPDLTNVTDTSNMFDTADLFDAPIGDWDVSNVVDMGAMFANAKAFNQDIGAWDVSNVTDMGGMFRSALQDQPTFVIFNQDIGDWDVSNVTNMNSMFRGHDSFNQDIGDWDVSNVEDMNLMFSDVVSFNQDIGGWDVSKVESMLAMFRGADSFDQDIGGWDVSSVESMRIMFENTQVFNQDIGGWDVSSVDDMSLMFNGAESFNQDIGDWDVSSVRFMVFMFSDAISFNQDIGGWDVSNVVDMRSMFANASTFNQDIGAWDVSNVTDMNGMFASRLLDEPNLVVFNQDIGDWDVSNVTDMRGMFSGHESFNQDIGDWDVSNVVDMRSMFQSTQVFNQDIGGWDVSNVSEIFNMFNSAQSFDQDLGNWDVGNVETMFGMFVDSNLSLENYDALLNGWSSLPSLRSGVLFDLGTIQYCEAEAARQKLIDEYGWVITDGGRSEDCGTEGDDRPFVTTWTTDNDGESADDQITIPTFPGETYNYTVNWGDGNTDTGVSGDIIHTYDSPGTYTISISDVFPRIYFETAGDKDKLRSIEQWGNNPWVSMRGAFAGCSNLQGNFSDSPDLSNVTNMRRMFNGATSFDHPIENWDVSSIRDMSSLFRDASSFNQDIGDWDVSNVTEMSRMFYQATSFNGSIGSWDVGNVVDMSRMFFRASSFDEDIASWNVSSVQDMSSMFEGPVIFNQDIGAWDVSQVTVMAKMFHNTLAFNQDIGGWDVSNVQDMDAMFFNALVFDQNIGNWNVGQAITMQDMFNGARVFNQDLGAWDVGRVADMENMFDRVDLSIENYDAILNGWGNLASLQSNVTFGAGSNTFCDGKVARQRLIDNFGWVITDGGGNCSSITKLSAKIAENSIPFDIFIHPNPSSDVVTISVDAAADIKEFRFYDQAGRMVQAAKLSETESANGYQLDVSNFNVGAYFLQAFDNSGRVYQKQLLVNK